MRLKVSTRRLFSWLKPLADRTNEFAMTKFKPRDAVNAVHIRDSVRPEPCRRALNKRLVVRQAHHERLSNSIGDAVHKSWLDHSTNSWLTTNEINYLPFVLSLSKDLIRVSLICPWVTFMEKQASVGWALARKVGLKPDLQLLWVILNKW